MGKPLTAPWTVPWAANLRILALAGAIELATADKTYGETPWDLGFDPLCFQEGKSKAEMDRLMLGELTKALGDDGLRRHGDPDAALRQAAHGHAHVGFLRAKERLLYHTFRSPRASTASGVDAVERLSEHGRDR